jgi:UDP-N-acetylglucosamine 2-epimerase
VGQLGGVGGEAGKDHPFFVVGTAEDLVLVQVKVVAHTESANKKKKNSMILYTDDRICKQFLKKIVFKTNAVRYAVRTFFLCHFGIFPE